VRHNPKDCGTVGAGNDTAAINAAIQAIRQDFGGVLELNGANTTPGNRRYLVDRINGTAAPKMKIEVDPGVIVEGSLQTAQTRGPILDLTGSPEVDIENGYWWAGTGNPWDGNSRQPPTISPTAVILIANADKTRLVSVKPWGYANSMVAVISGVSVTIDNCQLLSLSGLQTEFGASMSPPSLMLTSNPGEWGITSSFQTIQNYGYVNDVNVVNSEVHLVGTTQGVGWTTYMRNANHIFFSGGHSDCSQTAHMLFQGLNETVTIVGHKYYTELGHLPTHIFEGQCNNLRVYNPWPQSLQSSCSGTPVSGGFPGYVQG